MKTPFLVVALVALFVCTAQAVLTPPTFDEIAAVEYVSGPTAINGVSCNGPSADYECQQYVFHLWIKAPADTSKRNLVVNSHFMRRTRNGGCLGFPGATYFPGFSAHQITDQSDPDHWDLTLSGTYDYELDFPFNQDFFDADTGGTSRSDQREWDVFWHTTMAQNSATVYTSEPDPCATLSGASLDHCNRCTRCNAESDRGYCRTGVDVSAPPGTGTPITNPDTLLTCINECYLKSMADDCFRPAPVDGGGVWTGQLTYKLSAPDFSYTGFTYHALTLHGDNFLISESNSCPYGDTAWTHTHPGGVADSDLATPNISFEFDIHQQPLTGPVSDQPPVYQETFTYEQSV